ncbi:MAG: DUF5660 family protein [Candidatus Levyibacteriota bacterium]
MNKQAQKPKITHESIETKNASGSVGGSFSNIQHDVFSNLWKDLLAGSGKSASEQIFGAKTPAQDASEMYPGKIIDLQQKREEKTVARSEGHMEYFRKVQNADLLSHNKEDASMDRRVEEIRTEIKKLLATSKQLETTIKQVTVEQRVVSAGVYHENFFHFVLALLRSARVRMEEGMSWVAASKGKKQKKQQQQYWNMEKKHGTSFSLSSERSTATQTG